LLWTFLAGRLNAAISFMPSMSLSNVTGEDNNKPNQRYRHRHDDQEIMVSISTVPPGAPLRRRRVKSGLEQYAVSWMNLDPRRFPVASWMAAVMGFAVVIYVLVCVAVGNRESNSAARAVPSWISALRTIREPSDPSAMLDSLQQVCRTEECRHLLHELQTKRILEERIYQAMYQRELKRTKEFPKVTYDPREITEHWFKEIREQAEKTKGDQRYIPEPDWIHKSHPEICIVGNLKTGSSQLYNIFATHRDVHKIKDDKKEHCSNNHLSDDDDGPQSTYEYGLYSWHKYYYQQYDDKHPRVNGCVAWKQVERQLVYSPPNPKAKFFVLLRDPAEWAWAAYNFWCDEAWEEYDEKKDGNWVKESVHYRSPEVFHEVVLSGGKLRAFELLADLRADSVRSIRRLLALVGKDNLIILKNEDLTPDQIQLPGGALDRLSEATKLAKDGFDETILHSRSNCNAHKGFGATCTEESHKSGGYPVTHNRPMLEATRRFIYLQWHAECKIWAEEFGIVYPECLAAIDDSETVEAA
jgi:hypothetical protein